MQLVDQNQSIINGINKYKEEMKDYIKGKEMEVGDLKELYDKSVEERTILQNKLNTLIDNETKRLEELEKNKDIISKRVAFRSKNYVGRAADKLGFQV
jgi:septal ring factor EnvC (AmiA/AmiB activator)